MKDIKELTAADFVTPKGTTIEASCEMTPGECGIDADETGWDYDGTGTEHCYDAQEPEKDAAGRAIWLDNERERWVWTGTGWEEPATVDPVKAAMLEALRTAERLIDEAIEVHVYSDDDVIPDDCGWTAGLATIRDAIAKAEAAAS